MVCFDIFFSNKRKGNYTFQNFLRFFFGISTDIPTISHNFVDKECAVIRAERLYHRMAEIASESTTVELHQLLHMSHRGSVLRNKLLYLYSMLFCLLPKCKKKKFPNLLVYIFIQLKLLAVRSYTPVCRMEIFIQLVPHSSHMNSHMICAPDHHT